MSKVLTASCVGGVVSVNGVPVPGVTLLSEGVASSTGILIVDAERAYYVTNIGNDLDLTLGKLIAALNTLADGLGKAVDALTTLDTTGYILTVSGGSGAPAIGVPAGPVATSDISGISDAILAINGPSGIVSELETLKGSLQ